MDVNALKVADEVLRIIPLVTRKVAADLRKSDPSMKLAHIGLLTMVAQSPRSLSELSDLHAASMPTMSKTITTIENLGWVARSRSNSDRRIVMIEATPAGRTALREVHELAIAPIAEALDSLTATQRQKLSAGLKILRDTIADASPGQE
jgi:DNA-binding MarR family transcriptional regulator